jgi:hypothetical protein
VAVRRQVFESFDLSIAYDKAERRVELTATVSEAVADALKTRSPQTEDSSVVARDVAGARFVSRYHARIVERVRLVASVSPASRGVDTIRPLRSEFWKADPR